MAIAVSTNFKLGASLPLDERTVVASYSNLASIETKYVGMHVFVSDEQVEYTYTGAAWVNTQKSHYVLDLTGATSATITDYAISLSDFGGFNGSESIPRVITIVGTHEIGNGVSCIMTDAFDDNPTTGTTFIFENFSSTGVYIGGSTLGGEANFSIDKGQILSLEWNGSKMVEAARYRLLTKAEFDALATVEGSDTNGYIVINGTETAVYIHPTTAGNKHIPTGGSSGQVLGYSSSGTAKWITPDKTTVGLGNVDNTSDADKPVSTATEEAIAEALTAAKEYANKTVASATAYQGTIGSTEEFGTMTAALEWQKGFEWKISTAMSAGVLCTNAPALEVGDILLATADAPDADTASAGIAFDDYFTVLQTNLEGAVITDSTSSTDGDVTVMSGATGQVVRDSGTKLSELAKLASPTLTGTPKAPTAAEGTSTTQIATTAFVQTAVASAEESMTAELNYTNDNGTTAAVGGIAAGTTFENESVISIIENLLYPMAISFKATASGAGTYEKGVSVSPTLSITVTQGASEVESVGVYNSSNTLVSSTAAAQAGTQSVTLTNALTATTTLKAIASGGKQSVTSSTLTWTFVDAMYYGAVSAAPTTSDGVKALTKKVASKAAQTISFTTTSSAGKYCFAYPASYGSLKTILDGNGFDNTSDFTSSTVTVTTTAGESVSYYVYTYNNTVTAGTMSFTFKWS